MKKLLLGSTALVVGGLMAAPAMAADPIKMGVGGYYTFYAGGGSIGSTTAGNGTVTSYKGIEIFQEGEIYFHGQTKLDNGTTVGIRVELEGHNPAATTATAQIDEAYLFAFGDWGRVEFGSKDGAAYSMYYGTPSALIGFGFTNPNHNYTNASANANNKAARSAASLTIEPNQQDVNRINYYTPRFAGLQIGVGYAPKVNVAGPGGNVVQGPTAAGICGYNNATNNNGCPSADYSYQDMFDVGVNYLGKFGDVAVALYGAYMNMTFVPGFAPMAANGSAAASPANMVTGANMTNWKAAVGGINVSFAGFTLGAVYGWDNNGLGANYFTGVDNDTRFYSAGLMYETGAWQVSAGWAGFRNTNGNGTASVATITPGTNAQTLTTAGATGVPGVNSTAFGNNSATNLQFGPETLDKYEVGANYALGPGIKLTGGFTYYNFSAPGNAAVGDSWVVLLGMDLRF